LEENQEKNVKYFEQGIWILKLVQKT